MAEFRVTPQTLKAKANELNGLNSRYKSALDMLQSQEAKLNSQWDGEAHDAFHREFNNDMTRLQMFYNAIEEYVQKLNNIADEYEKAERTNISIAGR